MIPLEKVKSIIDTYETLEKELSSGNIDKKEFVKKSKEYSSIGQVINEARGYLSFEKEKKELEKIINEKDSDKEMKDFFFYSHKQACNDYNHYTPVCHIDSSFLRYHQYLNTTSSAGFVGCNQIIKQFYYF